MEVFSAATVEADAAGAHQTTSANGSKTTSTDRRDDAQQRAPWRAAADAAVKLRSGGARLLTLCARLTIK